MQAHEVKNLVFLLNTLTTFTGGHWVRPEKDNEPVGIIYVNFQSSPFWSAPYFRIDFTNTAPSIQFCYTDEIPATLVKYFSTIAPKENWESLITTCLPNYFKHNFDCDCTVKKLS